MNDFVHDYDDLDLARTELLGLTEDHHAVIYDQQERQEVEHWIKSRTQPWEKVGYPSY